MHIALVAPLITPIDDRLAPIGGAQALLADLARSLAAHGHRVTLLAADASYVRGVHVPELGIDASRLAPVRLEQGWERPDAEAQTAAFARVRAWLVDARPAIDVVHAHAFDAPAFTTLVDVGAPVVHTLHLPPLDPTVVAAAQRVASSATLVGVSQASAQGWCEAGAPVHVVVPNGIDVADVPFSGTAADYLLFVGRIAPEKGPDVALHLARAAPRPLVLVGPVYDVDFHARSIAPFVREAPNWTEGQPIPGDAVWLGHQPRARVQALMGRAAAVLLPARWDEPFGLVAVEAQAAGTGVVAFRRGALAEVIDPATSALAAPGDEDGFLAGILHVAKQGDRQARRAWVAQHFSLERMVLAYEQVYEAQRGRAG